MHFATRGQFSYVLGGNDSIVDVPSFVVQTIRAPQFLVVLSFSSAISASSDCFNYLILLCLRVVQRLYAGFVLKTLR